MKYIFIIIITVLVVSCKKEQDTKVVAQSKENVLPYPTYIVIVIEENHGYGQIIGNANAPYINSLATGAYSALFTNSFGVEHPSQPNYLDLYSGSNQGVRDDDHPTNEPFTTANLGRELIDYSYQFATYSEDLPTQGYNGDSYLAYRRKHNPAANWMGNGTNQIPTSTNRKFTGFPKDFYLLPTVSIVVPNQNHDMHDGTVAAADKWLKLHMDPYIQWCKTHRSLFILTFDEDDGKHNNHIVTIFCGERVKAGKYTEKINHYNILRTIETMYALPHAGNAANVKTITDCWK